MFDCLVEDLKLAGYAIAVYAIAVGSYWIFVG
jgi:hypothetical protein